MYNFGSLLGFCYSSSWLIGTACIFHLLFQYIRKFVHVTVNCWFCNNYSKVLLINKNEWNCGFCGQFNGFDKDGDYSKPIPEQFNGNRNVRYTRQPYLKKYVSKSNGLCRICNANQELKIRQLAIYEPLKEENYDQEIETFKQRLEESYKLCLVCEKTLQSTLKLKTSLFSKFSNTKLHQDEKVTVNQAKWLYISVVLILLFTAMMITGNYHQLMTDSMNFDIFVDFLNMNSFLTRVHEFLINTGLICCMMVFIKMKIPAGTIFGRPLLSGLVIYAVQDYLPLPLKIFLIFFFLVHCSVKWWQRKAIGKCRNVTTSGAKNRFIDVNEDEFLLSDESFSVSKKSIANGPLCGEFSGLTLGSSSIVTSPKNVPYLFRSTKSIIQPPRLKLDDSDGFESLRSLSTTSSGYESVVNYLKRSPDSISEFDSISQVGASSQNLPVELKCRYKQKAKSAIVTTTRQRFFEFDTDYKTPSPCLFSKNQTVTPSEHYYGVTSVSNPKQSPLIQTNRIFSTLQVILCSIAFFIFGFLFQLFMSKALS